MPEDRKATNTEARPLLRLIRQSGLYALGNVVVKASGLLLAPLYLNPAYLSVESFGYLALLTVTAQLGIFVVGLGLGSGLLKYMTDPEFEHEHVALPFTAFAATAAAAVAALIVLWTAADSLASILLDSPDRGLLIRLLGAYVALKVVGAIPLMMLRIHERAGFYAIAITAEILVLVAAAFYFLAVAGRGLEGIMLAFVVAAGTSTAIMSVVLLLRVSWTFRVRLLRPLIRYGAPLVMAGFAGWFLNAGDRYLLKWLSTADIIAVYEWSSRVAGVLNMLFVQSFQLAFSVIGLKSAGLGEIDLHRQTFRHYVVWTGWAVVGLSLLAYDVTLLLVVHFGADEAYLGVETLAFPIALGFLSYGIYIVVNNILYAAGRTRVIGLNVLGAAVLNAFLNVALIPTFGALGAAVATFASFSALAAFSAVLAEGEMKVGYPWRTALAVLILCVLLFLAGHATAGWPVALRIMARLGLIAAYPPLLLVTGLYSIRDVRHGWQQLQRRSG